MNAENGTLLYKTVRIRKRPTYAKDERLAESSRYKLEDR